MKYKEVGFREFYHNFVLIDSNEITSQAIDTLSGGKEANSVLGYCYYDREAGLTFEILAAAMKSSSGMRIVNTNDEVSIKIRIGAVEKYEIFVVQDVNGVLNNRFSKRLEMLKTYDPPSRVEYTRQVPLFDQFRHEWFIDDMRVRLIKKNGNPEECWVRLTGVSDKKGECFGILLNEPDQDFGYHEGDKITFYVLPDDIGMMTCFASANEDAVSDKAEETESSNEPARVTKPSVEVNELDKFDEVSLEPEEDTEDFEEEPALIVADGEKYYNWSKFYPDHCSDSTVKEMMKDGITLRNDGTVKGLDVAYAMDELFEVENQKKVVEDLIRTGWKISADFLKEVYAMQGDSDFVMGLLKHFEGPYPKELVMDFVNYGMDEMSLKIALDRCEEGFSFSEIAEIAQINGISKSSLKKLVSNATDNPTYEMLVDIMNCVDDSCYPLLKPFIAKLPFEQRIELKDMFWIE